MPDIEKRIFPITPETRKDKDGNEKFPMKRMVETITKAHDLGLKTTYYSTFISEDVVIDGEEDSSCSGGGCSV